MSWFKKNKKSNTIKISDIDRKWVNAEFLKLLQKFGYPEREMRQYAFNQKFFPETFQKNTISIEGLISDISRLLSLEASKISYEFVRDIRDEKDMPYMIKGRLFEAEVIFENNRRYHLLLANSLKENPARLLYNLSYELSKIKLKDVGCLRNINSRTYYDIFIAGVFFGFGLILSQKIMDTGRKTLGFWEMQWNYNSHIPAPVMAYALALFSVLNDNILPEWKDQLPTDIKKEYENCLNYLQENNIENIDLHRLKALNLYRKKAQLNREKKFKEANKIMLEATRLTNYGKYLAYLYNDIGYNYIKMNQLDKSIEYFQKSLEIFPGYEYANNNLGYVYIVKNELEKGKAYLDKIEKPQTQIVSCYKYRDLAIYYHKKGEFDKAQKEFNKAFHCGKEIDMLEYHYAEFLSDIGKTEEAEKYYKIAQQKKI